MLAGLKVGALGAILGALGSIDDALEGIVLVAAAGASLGWIFVRVLRPIAQAAAKTLKAVDSLERLPGFMDEQRTVNADVSERLDRGVENFRELNQRLSLAERAAVSVAEDAHMTSEHTQALVRSLGVHVRHEGDEHRDERRGYSAE